MTELTIDSERGGDVEFYLPRFSDQHLEFLLEEARETISIDAPRLACWLTLAIRKE